MTVLFHRPALLENEGVIRAELLLDELDAEGCGQEQVMFSLTTALYPALSSCSALTQMTSQAEPRAFQPLLATHKLITFIWVFKTPV